MSEVFYFQKLVSFAASKFPVAVANTTELDRRVGGLSYELFT